MARVSTVESSRLVNFLSGEFQNLEKRRITAETCAKFGYQVGTRDGQLWQIAPYYDAERKLVAQHLRGPNKEFKWVGEAGKVLLFGQHLWPATGRMVVITEGELDCLSMSQIQGNKWPVVSIPNGAQSAKKAIQRSLEWLNGFDAVVLMFDNDEPGIKAAQDCVELFRPGQCRIARLPLKDASDMMQAGRGDELIKAMWDAQVSRPDGIVDGKDLLDSVLAEDPNPGLPYPWPSLNTAILGMRRGELVTLCAGSGIGKSTYCRELAHYLMKQGQTIGYIALEENNRKTALGLMGIELNKRLTVNKVGITNEQLRTAFEATVGSGHCFLYDHFGSCDVDNLLNRIRYLAKGCGCGWIILDHLSIVVSGLSSDGDERKLIDRAMTSLRSLVEETGIGMFLVSHLKRPPEGKSFNEGRHISLSDLRGSAGIEQLSDTVLGIERNQQDADDKNRSCIRILKDRTTGYTGPGCDLYFDPNTGRLNDAETITGGDL